MIYPKGIFFSQIYIANSQEMASISGPLGTPAITNLLGVVLYLPWWI
jgi:predicted glycosyltransferase